MTFLNFALLGGLGLIAIPVVLHLAMRRQPRQMEFPALRFIARRRDVNRRRMRLRHLLLLLSRCALVALLALALARPSMQATGAIGNEEAPVAAALVFDTAPHMLYRHQDRTRLQEAREIGTWLVSQLPPESDVAVFDSRSGAAAFSVDLSAARQRLERLDSTNTPQPLEATIGAALPLLAESGKSRHELYVFSDLSQASWSDAALESLQKQFADHREVSLYLIDVGLAEPRNWSLGLPRLSAERLPNGASLQIQIDVASLGAQGERTVELWLTDTSGQPVRRGQEICTLGPGEARSLQFALASLPPGTHQGFLRIAGEDGLASDDVQYFSVETRPAWRVLVAAPPSEHIEPLFLAEALAPSTLRLTGAGAFAPDILSLSKLGSAKLTDYAIVVLVDPPPLDQGLWTQLRAYATAGGNCVFFLGRNGVPVEAFHQPEALDVLPGKLLRQFRAPIDGVFLAPTSWQHPALARFQQLATSIPWSESAVFRHWEFSELSRDANVLASFSNDLPAVIERPVGQGKVVTFTTPFSDRLSADAGPDSLPSRAALPNREGPWNLLPADWPGVMLVKEVFTYLAGVGEVHLNYSAGDLVVLPVPREPLPASLLVLTPAGENLRQNVNARRAAVEFSATDAVGNYRARAGGESAQIDSGFSINLSPSATQVARREAAEISARLAPARLQVARNRGEIDRDVNLGRVGRELFPLLILLFAACLAIESILSNRFYTEVRVNDDSQRARKWALRWRSPDGRRASEDPTPQVAAAP